MGLANLTFLYLDMDNNVLDTISQDAFEPLENLQVIYVLRPQICQYLQHLNSSPVCYFPSDGISSPEHLISHIVQRVSVWTLGLVTCLANMGVLSYRVFWTDQHTTNTLFIMNLCVADFLMGIYLLLLATVDNIYRGV